MDINPQDTTPRHDSKPGPLFRYRGHVWIQRSIEVLAENDDAFEDAVKDTLLDDDIDPAKYTLVKLAWTNTPAQWE